MDVEKRTDLPSVAYFSMEYGLANILKIYSGGLGILAGDYLKEASDCNVDMVAVGFLYRYGYFTQTLSMDGQQLANYEPQNFNQLPVEQVTDENGHPIVLEVPYPGRIPQRRFYDPYGNRTHVTAVKGPCLNRLTNGPYKYRASLKPPTSIIHYCGRPSPLS